MAGLSLDDLLALGGLDLPAAAARLGTDPSQRKPITGYGALEDVEALDSLAPEGVRLILRGDEVLLVYAGRRAVPEDLTSDELAGRTKGALEELPSRQAKTARMHVAPEDGLAWSEQGGLVAFVELFPPTSMEDYRARIYKAPGPFRR